MEREGGAAVGEEEKRWVRIREKRVLLVAAEGEKCSVSADCWPGNLADDYTSMAK